MRPLRLLPHGDFRLCDETDTLNRSDTVRYGSTPIAVAPRSGAATASSSICIRTPCSIACRRTCRRSSRRSRCRSATASNGPICRAASARRDRGDPGAGPAGPRLRGRRQGGGRRRDHRQRACGRRKAPRFGEEARRRSHDRYRGAGSPGRHALTGGELADLVLDCASGGPPERAHGHLRSRAKAAASFSAAASPRHAGVQQRSADHALPHGQGHARPLLSGGRARLADHRRGHTRSTRCARMSSRSASRQALRTVGGEGQPDAIHCAVDPWR